MCLKLKNLSNCCSRNNNHSIWRIFLADFRTTMLRCCGIRIPPRSQPRWPRKTVSKAWNAHDLLWWLGAGGIGRPTYWSTSGTAAGAQQQNYEGKPAERSTYTVLVLFRFCDCFLNRKECLLSNTEALGAPLLGHSNKITETSQLRVVVTHC